MKNTIKITLKEMRKENIFLLVMLMLFSACQFKNTCNNVETNKEKEIKTNTLQGVMINGVVWATTNLGAESPEDYGNYYTWEEAQIACPKGWRLPTIKELEMFKNVEANEDVDEDDENRYYDIEAQVPSVWTTLNGKKGRRFTDKTTGNDIFIPAAGFCGWRDGSLVSVGKRGDYWSSTVGVTSVGSDGLYLNNSCVDLSYYSKKCSLPVRCVAE